MSKSDKVQVRFGDAYDDWISAAQNSKNDGNDIFIVSPYITGTVIRNIFAEANASQYYVITELKSDSILSGSLDVDALLELHANGVKLFHVDNLHSKVLYYGHDLIIGSQNFTSGGRRNRETSVRIDIQNDLIGEVVDFINSTIENSSRLTIDIVKAVNEKTALLKDEYKRLRKAIKDAEKTVSEIKLFTDGQKLSATNISVDLIRHCQVKNGNWVKVERKRFAIPERVGDFYHSFVRTRTKMELNSFITIGSKKKVTLEHQKRYLGLNLHNLQPFWMPANKTQIAKFSRDRKLDITISKLKLVSMKLVDPFEHHAFANIIVKFRNGGSSYEEAFLFFDGKNLVFRELETLTQNLPSNFLHEIKKLLFAPFNFEDRNVGEHPNRYFRKGRYYSLSLLEFDNYHFIGLCEKLNRSDEYSA